MDGILSDPKRSTAFFVDRILASNIRTIPSALELLSVVGVHATVQRIVSSTISIWMHAIVFLASVSLSSRIVDWVYRARLEEIRDFALALLVVAVHWGCGW
jgi:hypothetical protein